MTREVVLDVSALQRREIMEPLVTSAANGGAIIVVPDVAFLELTKDRATWPMSVRKALGMHLPRAAHCVRAGRHPDHLLAAEVQRGEPVDSIVDTETSLALYLLLNELAEPGPGPEAKFMEDHFDQAALHSALPSGEAYLRLALQARDVWDRVLGPDHRRHAKTDPRYFQQILRGQAARACAAALVNLGASPEVAAELAARRSFSVSFFTTALAWGLYWLTTGGLDTRSPARARNDRIDLEYVALGAFTGDLVTAERGSMVTIYNHVRAVLDGLPR